MKSASATALLLAASATDLAHAVAGDFQIDCNYALGSVQTGYVPDFDQLRDQGPFIFDGEQWYYDPAGLPTGGNPAGGWNYCVPTAATNLVAWIANHGHPAVMPTGAPANFSHPDQYGNATWTISELGFRMGTDPVTSGTTYGGFKDGLEEWFDETVGSNVFDLGSAGSSGNDAPTLLEIGQHANAGHLLVVTVGWYVEESPGKWQRHGGHVTTLTGAFDYCSQTSARIRFRDPASDYATANYLEQSLFTNETYDLEYVTAEFSTDDPPVWHTRTHGRVVDYGATYPLGDLVPFLEAYAYITPLQGIGPGPNETLAFYNPNGLDPDGDHIDDLGIWIPNLHTLAVHPSLDDLYYIEADGNGGAELQRYSIAERAGESTGIAVSPNIIGATFGADGRLYTLEHQSVCCWDLSTDPPGVTCLSLAAPAEAMAVDDHRGTVLIISEDGNTVSEADFDTPGVVTVMVLPPNDVDLEPEPQIAVAPDNGALWVSSKDGRTAYKLRRTMPTTLVVEDSLTHPDLIGATSLSVGDDDTVYTAIGLILVYVKVDGAWQQLPAGEGFAGLPATGPFHLMHARWAIDDDLPLGPHDLPDHFAAPEPDVCLGDFDGTGGIGVPDLLVLLGGWGPNPGHAADFDGSGVIDVADLLLLLASWGQCLP